MSQRTVQGKIGRVSAKPFKDSRTGEDITLYSFQLEASNEWFRTGQNPIPAGVGQDVKFVANGANVERGTLVTVQATVQPAPSVSTVEGNVSFQGVGAVAQTAPRVATVPQSARPTQGTAASRDDYWANKEARDLEKDARFQAVNEPRMALSVATEAAALLVSTAIQKDAISFGNAAKAKKLGLLAAYTKEVALDLASFISDAPAQLSGYKASSPSVEGTTQDSEVQE